MPLTHGSYAAITSQIAAEASSVTQDTVNDALAGATGYIANSKAERFFARVEQLIALARRIAKEKAPDAIHASQHRRAK